MWIFDTFGKEIFSLFISLLTSLILWIFRARPILTFSQTHDFTFLIQPPRLEGPGAHPQQPPFTARTTAFWFANRGRVAATNIEVTFNYMPDNWQVWPVRHIEQLTAPDGRFTLRFSNLAPKEEFQIEVLAINPPQLMNVRCAESVGKHVLMHPMRVYPRWVAPMVAALLFLGVAAVIYILLRLGSFAVNIVRPG